MVYGAGTKFAKSRPCTNVPIHCQIFPRNPSGHPHTIIKYNATYHLAAEHLSEDNEYPGIPPELLVELFVTSEEERTMGVADIATTDWRELHAIPDSDAVEEVRETLKRSRAESSGQMEKRPAKSKRH
ncbi:hypothetical protein FA95DRAFT_1611332 [Auriscalpium vulgare]|uniref:Uncharacterized protein n=1 Tax=Auriscalpium vulgare TaxID=40419 RepID=A0ACB8RAI5_9AGAM|nr:hypothetical protein FA95DRAFT_1611332 [Auriscalpium vulgare]